MDPIEVSFSDLSPGWKARFVKRLARYVPIVERDRAPVVIAGPGAYGGDHGSYLKHDDALRIFVTGENVVPDFNLFDYAFGFHHICFGDRYTRLPNYYLYDAFDILRAGGLPDHLTTEARKFCCFVYSNGHAHPSRDVFFHKIGAIKPVDSAGGHLNNTGWRPQVAYSPGWEDALVAFYSRYKFVIAFENSSTPGYTTEKIVTAMAAGAIPIYWGNPLVHLDFNPRRFVNCHDYPSIDAVIARVMEIDRDEGLRRAIVAEPVFDRPASTPEATWDAFRTILTQTPEAATRRNRYVWGAELEKRARAAAGLR